MQTLPLACYNVTNYTSVAAVLSTGNCSFCTDPSVTIVKTSPARCCSCARLNSSTARCTVNATVTTTTLVCPATTCVYHPYALSTNGTFQAVNAPGPQLCTRPAICMDLELARPRAQVCGTPGTVLYSYLLPYSSFPAALPAASLTLSFAATGNATVQAAARAGFAAGVTQSADDYDSDPVILTDGANITSWAATVAAPVVTAVGAMASACAHSDDCASHTRLIMTRALHVHVCVHSASL